MKYHLAEWEGHTGLFHLLLKDVVSSVVWGPDKKMIDM